MGDKKQKEAMIKKVKQVLVVGACVLFVVLMILSGMRSHWLTIFTVIKPGDTVVVDYTMYDINGNPVLTSSQQTYTKAAAKGRNIIYLKTALDYRGTEPDQIHLPGIDLYEQRRVDKGVCPVLHGIQCDKPATGRHEDR